MTTTTDKPTAAPSIDLHPAVCMPKDFAFDAVPERPKIIPHRIVEGEPALGPLQAFQGDFVGRGFNTIFRPQNKATPTALPVPQPDSNNVLELNLTAETLSFSQSLGAVPNRGEAQGDIALNGVSYLQTITDVTDPKVIYVHPLRARALDDRSPDDPSSGRPSRRCSGWGQSRTERR